MFSPPWTDNDVQRAADAHRDVIVTAWRNAQTVADHTIAPKAMRAALATFPHPSADPRVTAMAEALAQAALAIGEAATIFDASGRHALATLYRAIQNRAVEAHSAWSDGKAREPAREGEAVGKPPLDREVRTRR